MGSKAGLCLLLGSIRVQIGGICNAVQVSLSWPLLVGFLTQGPQGTIISWTFTNRMPFPLNFLFSCWLNGLF